MSKAYVEPGKAALTGAVTSRKGASAYGEFYSDRRPDKDDDETQGYAEGSVWHYTDRQRVYLCVDPTEGAAVWRDLRDAAKVTIICRNNTGSTITKGSIVYVTGATGNHPTIALADKDSENTSSKTLGMVVADILTGADGSVAVNGTVDDLNTAAYVAGTPLYLGDNGGWTSPMPVSPAHSVFVGWVAISNANTGRIILHIQNGYELEEIHDVLITTPTNGQVLAYESSTSLWKNVAPGVGGSGAANKIAYFTGSTTLASDTDLHWNATDNRLGIKTATPNTSLQVAGGTHVTKELACGLFNWEGDAFEGRIMMSGSGAEFSIFDRSLTSATTNAGDRFTLYNSGKLFRIYTDVNQDIFTMSNTGSIGLGLGGFGGTASARVHAVSTTEQLRVGYNASNYASFTVTSAGSLQIASAGTTRGIQVESASGRVGFYGTTPVTQATTSISGATFTENSGTTVNDASTFDGYTLKQIVKALRELGLLT